MTFWVLTFIAEMLEVKGTLYFFDTFMEKRDGGYRNRYRFFVYWGVLYLVAVTGAWIGMLKCIPIILVMSFLNLAYYEVSFRQSFLFSIINYLQSVCPLAGIGGSSRVLSAGYQWLKVCHHKPQRVQHNPRNNNSFDPGCRFVNGLSLIHI